MPKTRRAGFGRDFAENSRKRRRLARTPMDRAEDGAVLVRGPAGMFANLSKYMAFAIVLLAICPVTAPFSTFDFAIYSSPVHEAVDCDAKSSIATPVVQAFLAPAERLEIDPLHQAGIVSLDSARLSLVTVLRL